MSNGIDIWGATVALGGYQNDIREAHAEERSAKAHFQQEREQLQDATKAAADHDGASTLQHLRKASEEKARGNEDQAHASEHNTKAWKERAEGYAKLGLDAECGLPGRPMGGPGCYSPFLPFLPDSKEETLRDVIFNGLKEGFAKGHK